MENSFIQGFLTEISNPKAIVFFVALLPLFIKPAGNIHLQFTILGVTSVTMETLITYWLWLYCQPQ